LNRAWFCVPAQRQAGDARRFGMYHSNPNDSLQTNDQHEHRLVNSGRWPNAHDNILEPLPNGICDRPSLWRPLLAEPELV
jgi:hypothetical protein